jgi:hypothetical protein
MEIKYRGWNRDMGTKTMVTHDLSQFRVSNDPQHTIGWSRPGLFARYGEVTVAWGQTLQHQGSYRMDLKFSQDDVFKLFKASYGRELDVDLLDNGFTVSEDLKKRMLSEIKLADLTIGDLAKLGAGSASTEPKEETAVVKPFRRL